TFFNENDRKIRNHTSLRELTELISKTHPKRVIIYHISSRYERILLKKEKELKELFPEIDIVMIKTQGVTEI
ncbi:MAG TPA: MBL fold metallo-hydrolase, partial [Petrotogaceae bacterium]|nr:MBL fold metallo-hydrolase [Petrotogaceae bacterium]